MGVAFADGVVDVLVLGSRVDGLADVVHAMPSALDLPEFVEVEGGGPAKGPAVFRFA